MLGELRRRQGAGIALVLSACAVAYANALRNGFAYDDLPIIVESDRVHQLHGLARLLWTPYWETFGRELGLYRPLAILGFALQWGAAGGAPWLFHLVNLALHAAVCVAVLLLLVRFVDARAAVFGAVLFAVHPLHTEVVANVVGQAELWATLAVVSACVLWASRPHGRVGAGRALAMAALYLLGLAGKESAIVLPGLLPLLDVAQGRHRERGVGTWLRDAAPAVVSLGAAAAAYLGARVAVLGHVTGGGMAPALPYLARPETRFLSALRAWPEYLRLLVWPADLSADYSPGVVLPVEHLTSMAALGAAILVTTVAASLLLPRRPRIGLPAAWFLVAVLPVSNLLFPIGVLLAERTLYLPSVAAALAAAFVADALMARATSSPRGARDRIALTAMAALLIALAAVRTARRNPAWRDNDALRETLMRDHPQSYRAQWLAAVQATQKGERANAEEHWLLASRIWPWDQQLLTDYGAFKDRVGDRQGAIRLLERARALRAGVPRTEAALGLAYFRVGRWSEAADAFDAAEGVTAPSVAYVRLRIQADIQSGRFDAAARLAREALTTRADAGEAEWRLLGRARAGLGDWSGAAAALDSAAARGASSTELGADRRRIASLCAAGSGVPEACASFAARGGAR